MRLPLTSRAAIIVGMLTGCADTAGTAYVPVGGRRPTRPVVRRGFAASTVTGWHWTGPHSGLDWAGARARSNV